jgi:heat shock protein HtpX
MPKPKVAIADSDVPNAFATGRSPDRAVVCATTGIMRRLDERELEGVLSHELSHVAHRDVTVMTIASFVGVLAGFLTRMTLYSGMFGGGRRNDNGGGAPAVLVITLVSVVVYALSFLLTRALSRYRELAADRAGAMLTGQPSALASALVKISGEMGRIPTKDLRQAEPFNAFFFTPAVAPGFSLSSLFSTHPTLEARLDQLGRISTQLGRPPA